MRNKVILIVLSVVVFSCSDKEKFKIDYNQVGKINATTTIENLSNLFENDSIVSRLSEGDHGNDNVYVLDNDTHLIYEKGGKLLLSITPINPLDSVSKIKSVTIFDERYKTEKGVHIHSTFSDLNLHHTIEKIEATFQLATVFVTDINATITLDKLALGLQAFDLGSIQKAQVPEITPFTSFTVWFEEEKTKE